MSGTLYIVGTPIGNLSDITVRGRDALASCEVVLAEDTRVTLRLLNHLGLSKRLVSCHEFNEASRINLLKEFALKGSSVALVSDAGMPLISDPGLHIVQSAIALEMKVIPIPGPSAFLLALVGSGIACDRFLFEGFLPPRKSDRKRRLESLKTQERTLIFYIPPHDQQTLLAEILSYLGDRDACLAREITKLHEEFIRGSLSQLLERVSQSRLKGEFVLVVAGAALPQLAQGDRETVACELMARLERGERLKEAASAVAKQFGWSKSAAYKLGLQLNEEPSGPADANR